MLHPQGFKDHARLPQTWFPKQTNVLGVPFDARLNLRDEISLLQRWTEGIRHMRIAIPLFKYPSFVDGFKRMQRCDTWIALSKHRELACT